MAEPTSAVVERTKPQKDGSFRVYLRLMRKEERPYFQPEHQWHGVAIVKSEGGRFVVDDLLLLEEDSGKIASRMSDSFLGCIGPRWAGFEIAGCTAIIEAGQESKENQSIIYDIRGEAYREDGKYDRAIQDFDQALRLIPDSDEAFYHRGEAYLDKKNYDQAIQDFDQTLRLHKDGAGAFLNRGIAYQRKGDLDRAIQDFDHALEIAPQNAVALHGRDVAHQGHAASPQD